MTGSRDPTAISTLQNKRILLGISGGIAAYKTPDLVRKLRAAGAEVEVVLTPDAERFVAPLALQSVAGRAPHRDLFADEGTELSGDAMPHISLARWADLLLIAPATADLMARLAQGRARDLLGALCLACDRPRLLAPAMNRVMWENSATVANAESLRQQGWQLAGPDAGEQACGEEGEGRMLEPEELVQRAGQMFRTGALAGKRVLVTAGPTHEALDPVRYFGNRSSGRMGFAIARAAAEAGARVELLAGPVQLQTPPGTERTDVVSARQMREAALRLAADADVFIACAAVADYHPVEAQSQKIKRGQQGQCLELRLHPNPDIAAEVSALPDRPFLLIFAAETENLLANAEAKLRSKGADMVAANDVSDASIGFDSPDNAVTLLRADGAEPETLPKMSKEQLARKLVQLVAEALR